VRLKLAATGMVVVTSVSLVTLELYPSEPSQHESAQSALLVGDIAQLRPLPHPQMEAPPTVSTSSPVTTTTFPSPPTPPSVPVAPPPSTPTVSYSSLTESSSGTLLANEPSWVQNEFACIRHAESDTTPSVWNATGSGASGLYQFMQGTWLSHSGGQFASYAADATVTEQNDVAVWTYERTGWSPWTGDPCVG